jgi:hypothetical protein
MKSVLLLAVLFLMATPASAATYFAAVSGGVVTKLMEASADNAPVPTTECPGCVVVSKAEYDAYAAAYSSAGRSKFIDKDDFMARFTPAEQSAITVRMNTNAATREHIVFMRQRFDITAPKVVAFIDALIAAGTICPNTAACPSGTAARKAELLARP